LIKVFITGTYNNTATSSAYAGYGRGERMMGESMAGIQGPREQEEAEDGLREGGEETPTARIITFSPAGLHLLPPLDGHAMR